MPKNRIPKVSVVEFTPKLAKHILESEMYVRQRGLREEKVDYLAEEIESGNFLYNDIVFCRTPDGRRHCINGQHTLHSIVAANVSYSLPQLVFDVDSEEEIAHDYIRVDIPSVRKNTDFLRAYDLVHKMDIPRWPLECFSRAAKIIMAGFLTSSGALRKLRFEKIEELMHELEPAAKKYMACIAETPLTTKMHSAPVMAVGIATMHYNMEVAPVFWEKVATDDGLSLGDPRKTLSRYLLMSDARKEPRKSAKTFVPVPALLRASSKSWNAWYDKRDLKVIKILSTTDDVILNGTPYTEAYYKLDRLNRLSEMQAELELYPRNSSAK